jgi:hypothetical protein
MRNADVMQNQVNWVWTRAEIESHTKTLKWAHCQLQKVKSTMPVALPLLRLIARQNALTATCQGSRYSRKKVNPVALEPQRRKVRSPPLGGERALRHRTVILPVPARFSLSVSESSLIGCNYFNLKLSLSERTVARSGRGFACSGAGFSVLVHKRSRDILE